MPVSLTKEQVAQLDEEQLDAYARVHLDSERTRRELRDIASGQNRNFWILGTATIMSVAVVIWAPQALNDPFSIAIVLITLFISLHTKTNRRIDAIVTLLELDRIPDNNKQNKSEMATPNQQFD